MTVAQPQALADLAATLTHRAEIGAEDVLALRRLVWHDGAVNRDEADALMALNTACHLRAPEWVDYFVEVMGDFLVHQQTPQGYVDEANAQWLMDWIDKDGRVDSLAELELLVKVLEIATAVPPSLKAYALRQIEACVLSGEGPTRQTGLYVNGGALDKGTINATEVELLRRIIFAQAGDGGYVVSRAEAEMLFRVKDATLNAGYATSWPDLFVKGVGNHLMAHADYTPLSREDQAGLDAYMADTSVSLGRFAGRVFGRRTDPRLSSKVFEAQDEAAARVDAQITPGEKSWLYAYIDADGARDALETALINFIRRERSEQA